MRRVVAITALLTLGVVGVSSVPAPRSAATSGSSRIAPIVIAPLGDFRRRAAGGRERQRAARALRAVARQHAPACRSRSTRSKCAPSTRASPSAVVRGPVARVAPPAHRRQPAHRGRPRARRAGVHVRRRRPLRGVDAADARRPPRHDRRPPVQPRTVNIDAVQAAGVNVARAGPNWVVMEGCCGPDRSIARPSTPTEAGYSTPGRFGIDLAQMDDQNRLVTDDPSQLTSYPSYGQYVERRSRAGRVVGVVDGLPDQVPGAPAPPGTFDEDTAQGNSVVVELGNGQYAFYGGLRPGSIIVKAGIVRAEGPAARADRQQRRRQRAAPALRAALHRPTASAPRACPSCSTASATRATSTRQLFASWASPGRSPTAGSRSRRSAPRSSRSTSASSTSSRAPARSGNPLL